MSQKIFDIAALLASYIHLKENYPTSYISKIKEKSSKDINIIHNLLLKRERLLHIHDKVNRIHDSFDKLLNFSSDGIDFLEKDFFTYIEQESKSLSTLEIHRIMEIITLVIFLDKKISNTEKEFYAQILNCFNIEGDTKQNVKKFKNRINKLSTKKLVISIFIFLILIISILFIIIGRENNINTFNDERLIFTETHFNRYIIYGNVADGDKQNLLTREVVYFIKGKGEVFLDSPADNLLFNESTGVLEILVEDVEKPFKVDLIVKEKDRVKVDEIIPKELGESSTATSAIILTGTGLGSLLGGATKSLKGLVAGTAFGLTGGIGVAYALKNKTLVNKITNVEQDKMLNKAEQLISIELSSNKGLLTRYKNQFKIFIIAFFAKSGKIVKEVKYVQKGS